MFLLIFWVLQPRHGETCAFRSSLELEWPGWALLPERGIIPCLYRNEVERRYFSTVLNYARTYKIIKTRQLCQIRQVWHTKQGRSCNTESRDCTEMNPTRACTSQRTWICNLVLNTVILSEAWTSLVNYRDANLKPDRGWAANKWISEQ